MYFQKYPSFQLRHKNLHNYCGTVGLYVFGGRGRTRTDADGRGHLLFNFFNFFFFLIIFIFYIHRSTGPIGARPRVRPLGSPPPPHTHHDHMKIYIVYRLSLLFIFFLTAMYTVYTPGGGVHFICICAARMPLFLTIFLSLAT